MGKYVSEDIDDVSRLSESQGSKEYSFLTSVTGILDSLLFDRETAAVSFSRPVIACDVP